MVNGIPEVKLNDGLSIPAIGLGTYQLKGSAGAESIRKAIDEGGYRLLDSAYNYENEGTVGEAVKRSSVSREDLLITSKLPGRYHESAKGIIAIEESLYRAGLDYYDIYLIHWPNPKRELYVEAWQTLIEAKKKGYVRSIGVCNFLPEHLDRLEKETGVKPSMNQVELHPYFNQEEERAYHEKHGILTESWSPLGRGSDLLGNGDIQKIAEKHGKSIAQVILRWHYQLGAVSIPKSSSAERQKENISIFDFELDVEDMEAISKLSHPGGRLHDQDPAEYEEF
ncbi:aldo/keto reductase [Bacillus infantis]|uniref:Aldo/keto reductase n=1 Tax=Bacillus infantis TaxID=324767 RepID=A0A5D4SQF5_9BACI|nr:aldo/keto reductase [Bacillus infantis]TYS64991.1 aldo/keto reductase [Bacillus infantis]